MSEAPPDIFLSYNREDAAVAQTYRDAFEREGFDRFAESLARPEMRAQVTRAVNDAVVNFLRLPLGERQLGHSRKECQHDATQPLQMEHGGGTHCGAPGFTGFTASGFNCKMSSMMRSAAFSAAAAGK